VAGNSAGTSTSAPAFRFITRAVPTQSISTTVRNQRLTLTAPARATCQASSGKLDVTLVSSKIPHSKERSARFVSARISIDAGRKRRLRHLPARLALSLSGLKHGTHKLTVQAVYNSKRRHHGDQTLVALRTQLRARFTVC
jgi:hypothetical protein